MKTHEILTPAQNAQEALELEQERSRRERCVKERDGPEKQMPTPEAVAVLQNEAARHKTIQRVRKGRHIRELVKKGGRLP